MKQHRLIVIVSIIFLLICTALYVYIYTIPEITGALKSTVIVEYGQMTIAKEMDAVIVRQEQVFTTDVSGNVSYYVDNNTKTRNDIRIMDIYGSSEDNTRRIVCPQTGVVSYYYDGYESVMTPETLADTLDLLPSEEEIKVVDIKSDRKSAGDPVYKLITSDTWYTVFKISADEISEYQNIYSVGLVFDTGTVDAHIENIIDKDDGSCILVVATAKYFKDYDRIRECRLKLVLRDNKGLIVPNTAIAEVDGNQGVYVKKIDGEFYFTRIKVISSDGDNSVVYADSFSVLREDGLTDTVSTISIYDEILKDASEQDR